MTLLGVYLLLGLVAHKAVWEYLRRGAVAPRGPMRPIKLVKIALLAGFAAQTCLPPVLPFSSEPGFGTVIGAILFTLGLAVAITARVQLGRNWANVESATVVQDQHLVDAGLYGQIRHPIYLGDLLLVAGLELALNSWLVVLALPLTAYVAWKAAQEEAMLAARLDGYAGYVKRTGRFLPRCLAVGLAGLALAGALQCGLVYGNYGGDWTALYLTGNHRLPAEIQREAPHVFQNSSGYDGQYYHLMAHDPLLRRGMWQVIDAPRLRYPRILMPALVYVLALGRDEWIDPAFFTVNLLAFGFAAWWLARLAVRLGFNRFLGLAVFLLPGAWISLERIVVDSVLMALAFGFLLYVLEGSQKKVFVILALAALTRETGLLLWGAYGLYLLLSRKWVRALSFGAAVLPLALWMGYVAAHTPGLEQGTQEFMTPAADDARFLYSAFLRRFFEPVEYPLPGRIATAAAVLDYAALAGTLLATLLAFYWFWKQRTGPLQIAAAVWAALPWLLGGIVGWYEPFGYPRTLTPLFILLLYAAMSSRRRIYLLPLALVLPRIGMQLAPHLPGVRRLLGS